LDSSLDLTNQVGPFPSQYACAVCWHFTWSDVGAILPDKVIKI